MMTSTIDTQDLGVGAGNSRKATQPLQLARFRAQAQAGIDAAARLAREGSEQAHALAQRLLEAVMLMLRTLLRVLARVLHDFKAGFGAGYETPAQGPAPADASPQLEGANGAAEPLEAAAVARNVEEALPTEIVAQDAETAAKARRVVELTADWAADRLEEIHKSALQGEFHAWSPAIAAAMKSLATDAPVLAGATKTMDDAHAALHAAAAQAAARVGAGQHVSLFTDALTGIMLENDADNASGRHLLPKMVDAGGEFGVALRNYRDAAAAHRIALDRVHAVLESAAPIGSSERSDLERAVHDAYPGLLQPHEMSAQTEVDADGQGSQILNSTTATTGKASQDDGGESKLPAASNLLADDVPYERWGDDEDLPESVLQYRAGRPSPFAVLIQSEPAIEEREHELMAATG
jgi:hypothetical protein